MFHCGLLISRDSFGCKIVCLKFSHSSRSHEPGLSIRTLLIHVCASGMMIALNLHTFGPCATLSFSANCIEYLVCLTNPRYLLTCAVKDGTNTSLYRSSITRGYIILRSRQCVIVPKLHIAVVDEVETFTGPKSYGILECNATKKLMVMWGSSLARAS